MLMMDWSSYWWGVATLPIVAALLAVLALVCIGLFARVPSRGTRCICCDWRFAGLAENYGAMGGRLSAEPNRPTYLHAHASQLGHDLVITRTPRHRAAWTAWFDGLHPSSSMRRNALPRAKRMGVKDRC